MGHHHNAAICPVVMGLNTLLPGLPVLHCPVPTAKWCTVFPLGKIISRACVERTLCCYGGLQACPLELLKKPSFTMVHYKVCFNLFSCM